MSLRKRFKMFQETFPDDNRTYHKWLVITQWFRTVDVGSTLDTGIFPDGMRAIIWDHSDINKVIINPDQTKLRVLSFSNTRIRKLTIPDSIKTVEAITLFDTPVTTLELGGSIKKLKTLTLRPTTATNRVTFPVDMTGLIALRIDSSFNSPSLPRGAVNLESLQVRAEVGDNGIRIPSEYVNLKNLDVSGSFGRVSVPNAPKLNRLDITTDASTFIMPELPSVVNLHIMANKIKSLIIPMCYDDVYQLVVRGDAVTSLELPTTLKDASAIEVACPETASITIPETSLDLKGLRLKAKVILIKPPLPNLDELIVVTSSIKVEKPKTLGNLRHLSINKESKVSMALPNEMLLLESLHVNTQRVRFKNIHTPRLDYMNGPNFIHANINGDVVHEKD